MIKNVLILLLIFSIIPVKQCQRTNSGFDEIKKAALIPRPQSVTYGNGTIELSYVDVNPGPFENEARKLSDYFDLNGILVHPEGVKVFFEEDNTIMNFEAYSLEITDQIKITAKSDAGIFYAIQTLKQLLQEKKGKIRVPQVRIYDSPSFAIRGFMHDTGRNFQSIEQLKEQLDVMAFYKYNVFHWHLTDNPGWRLESKIYPELQSQKAFSRHPGKYYSQEDFKDILAYCKERHITVIPELDIPGHSQAFRKAFGLKDMRDPRVPDILLNLFGELCELADKKDMPYIHIGTDEVRNQEEQIDLEVIHSIMKLLKQKNREVIVWKEGIVIEEDDTSINQLWAQYEGRKGHRFIDSRSNYINHLDPFAGMSRLFFQQPCRQAEGDTLALGGILCAWPDNNIGDQRNVLIQNPIYPSMVFYSDAIWNGRKKDRMEYWANLPEPGSIDLASFQQFENTVVVHRDRFFQNKEFPYISQSEIQWKLLGPLDHQGDINTVFEVENVLKSDYYINGKYFKWEGPFAGGTIHLKHFFGFKSVSKEKEGTYYAYNRIYSPEDRIQDFWIGFQGWSRSSRRGGPTPSHGQWHSTNPKIWVNGKEIDPPVWQQPGLDEKDSEMPYVDEDYFYRETTKIELKKGWNQILLKIPQNEKSWKWMFTCVPVSKKGMEIKEVKDLKYSTEL